VLCEKRRGSAFTLLCLRVPTRPVPKDLSCIDVSTSASDKRIFGGEDDCDRRADSCPSLNSCILAVSSVSGTALGVDGRDRLRDDRDL
jgi:hypothetical protein